MLLWHRAAGGARARTVGLGALTLTLATAWSHQPPSADRPQPASAMGWVSGVNIQECILTQQAAPWMKLIKFKGFFRLYSLDNRSWNVSTDALSCTFYWLLHCLEFLHNPNTLLSCKHVYPPLLSLQLLFCFYFKECSDVNPSTQAKSNHQQNLGTYWNQWNVSSQMPVVSWSRL